MSRASTPTLLPLDTFARIINYSPILFGQVYVPGEYMQPITACSDPVLQYTWQPRGGGAPGREEIAQAIAQAEDMVETYLGFSPLPKWYNDLDTRFAPSRPGSYSAYVPYTSGYQALLLSGSRFVMYGGREAWSAIQLAAAVVYTDTDSDGYFETATVTVATTVTDVDEIAVYYPGTNHDRSWEVRPITVSISGGVATITFARHQAVKPDLLEALSAGAVDGLDDPSFLTTVDVYRQYNDPSQMAVVEWSPPLCDPTVGTIDAQAGAVVPLDARLGILGFNSGTWDAATQSFTYANPTWWRQPNRARLWLRAGYRDGTAARPCHDMSRDLARAIAYLALSYLDREWQSCEQMRNLQAHWRADLAIRRSSPSESTSYQLARGLLDNPFGTTRAAVFAWRVVQQMMVGEAVLGG